MNRNSPRISTFARGLTLLASLSVGCGDGAGGPTPTSSGVSRGKTLAALTSSEIRALCSWVVAVQGGPGERACGFEGGTLSVNTVDACVTGLTGNSLRCQVAVVEDCMNSLEGDACKLFATSACKVYFDCLAEGG